MPRKSKEQIKREKTNEIKARYEKKAMKFYAFKLHKINDADIIDLLDSQENKSAFIKECIKSKLSSK